MSRRKQPVPVPAENPSDIEARADRLETAMKREEKALKKLAALRAQREEMGMEQPSAEGYIEEGQFPGGEPPQIPEATRLERILAEIGTEGSFEVLRKDGMEWSSVGIYELADYPDKLHEIAKECGGGKFQLKFKNANGQWAGQVTRSFDSKFFARPASCAAPVADNTTVMLEMQKLMMQMQEQSKRDMMDLMKTIISANNRPNPLMQSAADVAAMQQAFGGGRQAVDPLAMTSAILKAAQELKDMTEGKLPSDEGDEPMKRDGDFFKLVIDGIMKAVTQRGQAGAAPQVPLLPGAGLAVPPAPVNPGPGLPLAVAAPALPPPSNPGGGVLESSVEVHPLLRFKSHPLVALYAPVLVDFAQKGTDPLLVADVVFERIPSGFETMALDIVGRPDFFEVLCQYDPRLRPHQVWVVKVVDALKMSLRDETTTGEGPEGESAPAEVLTPLVSEASPNGGKPTEKTDGVVAQGESSAGS